MLDKRNCFYMYAENFEILKGPIRNPQPEITLNRFQSRFSETFS